MIVGAAQLSGRDSDNEPIEMMTTVAKAALAQGPVPLDSVRVVGGIWPYQDPGSLVAERLGITASTALTRLGGNEALDLVNTTAQDISNGHLDAALICSAETMRTRRRDRRAGRKSPYLTERDGAAPGITYGSTAKFWEAADETVWATEAVNFYAMASSAVRHQGSLTPTEYTDQISELWANASAVAGTNPHAWLPDPKSAAEIAEPSESNRMVAAPYTKLMTSNINVDQAAALVICSTEVARAAGIDPSTWIFPLAGTGGHDPLIARTRWSFAESPTMRIAGRRALAMSRLGLDEIDRIDLYSCFPSAVQVGMNELGLPEDRPFTITGGMTFAGGPFNSYSMHSAVRAIELLRDQGGRALVTGNGGWLTKHSFSVLSTDPEVEFRYERPQDQIDAEPVRPTMTEAPENVTIHAYTIGYSRTGEAQRAMLVVSDSRGARAWATSTDDATIAELLAEDCVGRPIPVTGSVPVLTARF